MAGSGEQGTGGCYSVPTGWSTPRRGAGRSTLLPCPALAGPGGGKILGNSFLRQGAFLFLQATCEGGWGSGPFLLTRPPIPISLPPPPSLCPSSSNSPPSSPPPPHLCVPPSLVCASVPPSCEHLGAPTGPHSAGPLSAGSCPQPQELPSAWGPGTVGTVTESRSEACFHLTLNVSPFAE